MFNVEIGSPAKVKNASSKSNLHKLSSLTIEKQKQKIQRYKQKIMRIYEAVK